MQNVKKLFLLFFFSAFSLSAMAKSPEIVKAIKAGDLGLVQKLVDSGTDIDILIKKKYEDYTETLLHRAIYEEQPEILRFLIKKFKENDISIDKMGSGYGSALMYACSQGYYKYAEILINNGANINFDNGGGETPFLLAIVANGPIRNRIKCCQLLKAAGAKLTLRYSDLMYLIEYPNHYTKTMDFAKKNMSLASKARYFLCKTITFLHKRS
ncbi:MAG: ankyrin repeat domain-containing protein [bacterium]